MARFLRFWLSGPRFVFWLKRFAPFWGVWALVWLLPPTREVARLSLFGSPVARDVPGFATMFRPYYYGDSFDPRPLARQNPRDPNLAYWVLFWRGHGGRGAEETPAYYGYGATSDSARQSLELAKRFPDQLWLQAAPLRFELFLMGANRYNSGAAPRSLAAPQRRELLLLARRAQKLEPNNAFWFVAEAMLLSKGDKSKRLSAESALIRAARATRYDDYDLESTRRLLGAQQKVRALSWQEKRALLEREHQIAQSQNYVNRAGNRAWTIRARNNEPARALSMSAALVHIGALMQRGSNAPKVAELGAVWQRAGWRVGNVGRKRSPNEAAALASFQNFARSQNRPELAIAAQRGAARINELRPFLKKADAWRTRNFWLDDGDLMQRAEASMLAGFTGIAAILYLALWWLVAGLFLWRGQGVSSTKRDRIWPVLLVGTFCLALALLTILWFVQEWNGKTPRAPRRDETFASIGVFAFFAMPFLLALLCASSTIARHRERFALTPRVELELRLSPFLLALLKWFWPGALFACIAAFGLGWLVWTLAIWRDWGAIDFLKMLPPDRNGFTGSWTWIPTEPIPALYGVFMVCLALLGWFWKWRYAANHENRPVLHGGLRWWRECLGTMMVLISVLYGILALASFPMRQTLDARVERLAQVGELSFVVSSSSD